MMTIFSEMKCCSSPDVWRHMNVPRDPDRTVERQQPNGPRKGDMVGSVALPGGYFELLGKIHLDMERTFRVESIPVSGAGAVSNDKPILKLG
jgi:hypothetical protein